MAESYYYLVDFEAVCEECGKRFSGVISKEVPVNDSVLAGNILNSAADSVDAGIRKKMVENAVRDKRWADLDMHYGGVVHGCPHCGARQSWDPLEKPKEPKKVDTIGNKAVGIGCSVVIAAVVAMIAALAVSFVLKINFMREPTLLFVLVAMGVVVGVVLGVRHNKKAAEKEERYGAEIAERYQRELAAYNDYQAKVAARDKLNEPLVTLSSGRFTDSLDALYAQAGLDWRDF